VGDCCWVKPHSNHTGFCLCRVWLLIKHCHHQAPSLLYLISFCMIMPSAQETTRRLARSTCGPSHLLLDTDTLVPLSTLALCCFCTAVICMHNQSWFHTLLYIVRAWSCSAVSQHLCTD
jgi:hypothetical protein